MGCTPQFSLWMSQLLTESYVLLMRNSSTAKSMCAKEETRQQRCITELSCVALVLKTISMILNVHKK